MHIDLMFFVPGVLLIAIGVLVTLSPTVASRNVQNLMKNVVGRNFARIYSVGFMRFMGIAAIVVGAWGAFSSIDSSGGHG